MNACVEENLNKGIKAGLFRESIDVGFISRIYFNGINGIKDIELFPLQKFSMNTLLEYFLEYHLRGICTEEGIQTMNEIITTNNQSK